MTDPRVERFRERLMTFGGFDRRHVVGDHEEGSFWVNRDNVLRLLDEEFGAADAVEGDRSKGDDEDWLADAETWAEYQERHGHLKGIHAAPDAGPD